MTFPQKTLRNYLARLLASLFLSGLTFAQSTTPAARTIPLPSSKMLMEPVPGSPQKTNSLPMAMAISPDGRYVAIVNAGYGTAESKGEQSVAILDAKSGKLLDFPNAHTPGRAQQTLYAGIAFSSDGKHLYVSIASLTHPLPAVAGKPAVGNGIVVYGFTDGQVTEQGILPIPLQQLADGKRQNSMAPHPLPDGMANPFPSGLTVVHGPDGDRLLIADNLSDDALLMDASDGRILYRFDLSTSRTVPASYPIATVATRDGKRGFVALWNASEIAELDLVHGQVVQMLPLLPPRDPVDPSSHPAALALNASESVLYVALANRDSVAAVSIGTHAGKHSSMRTLGFFDTRLPGQTYFGAFPDALALSPDGNRLYVADASLDAIAVFNPHSLQRNGKGPIHPHGFIPTEWYPTALAATADDLYVATGKGQGTGPNNFSPATSSASHVRKTADSPPHTYIASLLYGSLAAMNRARADRQLEQLSNEVMESNRMHAAQQEIRFRVGGNPIRHVIYIIKENRSYDQVFGDLKAGNNDPSLTMYGRAITPNEHKLAEQFGILDNFYDSGEVSGDGHVWSTAAITSDYTEKTWQQSYRGDQRTYDYEGIVAKGYPLQEKISDVDEPASGYLWTNLARHGKTYYHFGEFVATTFCSEAAKPRKPSGPLQGTPEPTPQGCARNSVRQGEQIPANYGGGISDYPWRIPLIARDTATKPELVGHFDPQFQDFELSVPDQFRVSEFLAHFRVWVADRAHGKDTMPAFVMLRLPDDHTAGTTPGMPRPEASIADNDLAVGRAVDAVSHSAFWNDTAFFILEDDAQDGADHVDAHRSLMLMVSKYAPRPKADGTPFVDHHFYTTVSAVRTQESLLGLPPMNNNDAFAPLLAPEFSGDGAQPAYNADYENRDNGRIYEANTPKSYGAKQSAKMDFRHADMADTSKLNVILWRDEMGDRPVPPQLLAPHPHHADADGD
ncbi:MAG: bifunctional YncE family protein/alkaline phosphatase family protein [Acidobacteriaceae bacterium]